jgi:hypothetical protein
MKLLEAESALHDLTMSRDEKLFEGAEPKRQRLYRRLVRGNLFTAVKRAIPITRKILGEDAVDAMVARFLDEVGPRTRLVRMVASEFASWLMAQPELPHAATAELAHWEALEIEVGMAAEYDGPSASRIPADDARVETHPSARLAAYRHRVHAMTTSDTAYPDAESEPTILLAWRQSERFYWQTLEGSIAKTLVECAEGKTLGDAFHAIEANLAAGDVFDRARVKAQLVDLCRRGALVGFPR